MVCGGDEEEGKALTWWRCFFNSTLNTSRLKLVFWGIFERGWDGNWNFNVLIWVVLMGSRKMWRSFSRERKFILGFRTLLDSRLFSGFEPCLILDHSWVFNFAWISSLLGSLSLPVSFPRKFKSRFLNPPQKPTNFHQNTLLKLLISFHMCQHMPRNSSFFCTSINCNFKFASSSTWRKARQQ